MPSPACAIRFLRSRGSDIVRLAEETIIRHGAGLHVQEQPPPIVARRTCECDGVVGNGLQYSLQPRHRQCLRDEERVAHELLCAIAAMCRRYAPVNCDCVVADLYLVIGHLCKVGGFSSIPALDLPSISSSEGASADFQPDGGGAAKVDEDK